MTDCLANIEKAVHIIKNNGIVAYSTETVWGLGCDPWNYQSVLKLLSIKKRNINKGLILLVAHWDQVDTLINPLPNILKKRLNNPVNYPITWLIPDINDKIPYWIKGNFSNVAVRKTSCTNLQKLCEKLNSPIISTSANITGYQTCEDAISVATTFKNAIDGVFDFHCNHNYTCPSEIRELATNTIIRPFSNQ